MSRATSDRTEWTCPTCRAVGSIEHAPKAASVTILALVKTAHAIKQPRCHGEPVPIAGTQTALPWPPTLRHREGR